MLVTEMLDCGKVLRSNRVMTPKLLDPPLRDWYREVWEVEFAWMIWPLDKTTYCC